MPSPGLNIRKIESPSNPVVKDTLAQARKRSASSGGAFLIEGQNLFAEALRSGRVLIQSVFVTEEFLDGNLEIFEGALAGGGINIYEVSQKIIKKLSATETPQGVCAMVETAELSAEHLTFDSITVVLDGIQDPGNTGTIIRTAHAFGSGAVVLLPGTCDAMNPKALRATAGSVFHIPVIRAQRDELVRKLRKDSVRIAMTEAHGGVPLSGADLSMPLAFVLGSEARGVSEELRRAADLAITIPVPGGAESLNVAQAAALCLWEAQRSKTV